MNYQELTQLISNSCGMSQEDAKENLDNQLGILRTRLEHNDIHYADYYLACEDLGIELDYIPDLINLIEPER